MPQRPDSSRYSSLLERPDLTTRTTARRRRRRRSIAAALVLVLVTAGVAFAIVRTTGGTLRFATLLAPRRFAEATAAEEATAPVAASKPTTATTTARRPAGGSTSAGTSATAEAIEIGWVGDTTPGSKYGNPPDNGRALFGYTAEYTRAPDIMIGNLEGTFGNGGPSKCSNTTATACFAFQAPPKNAAALSWAGFDVMNLANNHSNDYLYAGLQSTKQALRANDIAYTGLDGTVAVRNVGGTKVAVLGFSPYPWSPSIKNLSAAKTLVRRAAESADVVVVVMHAGAEGVDKSHTPKGAETAFGEFRGDPRAFSHAVIDAGAHVVLGSGPHVIRGMESYRGRLIAYSLGNFAGWKNFGRAGDLALSGLLTVKVAKDGRVLGGKWLSLRLADPGVPKVDPSGAAISLANRRAKSDFETPVTLRADGTFTTTGP